MNTLEIGIVTMNYNEDGTVIKELSHFTPTLKTTIDTDIEEQLLTIKGENDSETLKHNANAVLAGFFTQITNIELADRSEYVVDSEVVTCEKYPTGGIKTCVLKYYFRRIV